LSILYYINTIQGIDFSLTQLRTLASQNGTAINGEKEDFDYFHHHQSLVNVCNVFNLQIHFYGTNGNKQILRSHKLVFGNIESSRIVSIVSYGYHFELITSIGHEELFKVQIKDTEKLKSISTNSTVFKPNKTLVLGKQSPNILDLNAESEVQLDKLFKALNFYHQIAFYYASQQEALNIQLSDISKTTSGNEFESFDYSLKEAIKQSVKDAEVDLKKRLEEIKKQQGDVEKQIADLKAQIQKIV
jgi:hypothetical protein